MKPLCPNPMPTRDRTLQEALATLATLSDTVRTRVTMIQNGHPPGWACCHASFLAFAGPRTSDSPGRCIHSHVYSCLHSAFNVYSALLNQPLQCTPRIQSKLRQVAWIQMRSFAVATWQTQKDPCPCERGLCRFVKYGLLHCDCQCHFWFCHFECATVRITSANWSLTRRYACTTSPNATVSPQGSTVKNIQDSPNTKCNANIYAPAYVAEWIWPSGPFADNSKQSLMRPRNACCGIK
jgi:hypothetical protein